MPNKVSAKKRLQPLETKQEASVRGVIPLLSFVILFTLTGVLLNNFVRDIHSINNPSGFYLIYSPIFTFIPIIIGFLVIKGSLKVKMESLINGAVDKNILLMIFIYILSGIFSSLMNMIGATSAVAYLGFKFIPVPLIVGGVFLVASILSTAIGTSVGTIVAFGPIVFAIGKFGHINPAELGGALLCGAMFGDDLSIISDTAIASCRTQNVQPKDRFFCNLKILFVPAIIAMILYFTLTKTNRGQIVTDN